LNEEENRLILGVVHGTACLLILHEPCVHGTLDDLSLDSFLTPKQNRDGCLESSCTEAPQLEATLLFLKVIIHNESFQ